MKKSLMKNFIFSELQETYKLCLGTRTQVNYISYYRMFSQFIIFHIKQKVHRKSDMQLFRISTDFRIFYKLLKKLSTPILL